MRSQGKPSRLAAPAQRDGTLKASVSADAHVTVTRHRGRKAACTATSSSTSLGHLPIEVIQVIGSKLAVQDLRVCRLVCKVWAKRITQGKTNVSLCMHPDTAHSARKLNVISELVPIASAYQVHISNRQPQAAADQFLQQLQTVRHLRDLELVFRGSAGQDPKWPVASTVRLVRSYKAIYNLTQLTCLAMHDSAVPCFSELTAITSLKALTRIAFTSSDDYRAGNADLFKELIDDLHGCAGLQQMQTLCSLASLCSLEVPISGSAAKRASQWGLSQLTRLTSLTLHGPSVSMQSIREDMQGQDTQASDDSNSTISKEQHATLLASLLQLQVLNMTLPHDEDSGVPCGLDQDTCSRLRSVTLTVWPSLSLGVDVSYLSAKLGSKLRKLIIRLPYMFDYEIPMLSDAAKSLEHLEICFSSGTTPFSRIINSVSSSTRLKRLIISRPHASSPPKDPELHASLVKLASTLSDELLELELEGIVDQDFEAGTQQVLQQFKRLQVLSLKCADNTKCKLPVSFAQLPRNIKQVKLRFAQIQGLSVKQLAWLRLEELTLISCALDKMRSFKSVLGNLHSLKHLHLENLTELNDDYMTHLSGLTGLTSLAVMAISNHAVTNASLAALTTLTGLQKLTWHVGDMLDATPDVVTLKAFSKLLLLSLTTSMFYRLSRWGALNVMDFLPYCQVDTIGP